MDNRITRRRLYNFLSYEWIVMIVVAVACILAWNLIFTMTSVKLTVGQDFKFFYDETIDSNTSGNIYTLFEKQDDPERTVFSYDLLKIGHETLQEQYNVLKERMSVQEGDIIITDATEPADDAENKDVRAKTIIDTYPTYDFISLKEDAEEYLAQFLKDGLTEDADVTDFNNLDGSKIEEVFRERMRKDNRYRSEGQKQEGIALEKERIEDLCKEVKRFRHLLNQGDEYFFMYKRYDQIITEENKETLNADEYRKKGVRPYGLKVEALSGGEGKDSPSKYFKKIGADDAKDVVILVFDLKKYQPHLQFEAIAFINAVVSGCSNLYDVI
ncbi:MAG: hypothetical protein IJX16_03345 [Clostridia bacterium]|nr:hypothetical protein [Clostridia bacterium]